MRPSTAVLFVVLAGSWLSAQSAPPTSGAQQPVFRTGVDLLTVDATVVDREGRQVTDLGPDDFVIEVDGDARTVVSAEYVRLAGETPAIVGAPPPPDPGPPPDEPFFSTNARTPNPGRLVLLLVDEGNIRAGQGRQMMRTTVKFVDGLSPQDRLAMVGIPRGRLVDFTTNHERVREALLGTVGQATPFRGRFFMSLSEAFAAVEHSDAMLRTQLILRECAAVLNNPIELTRCEIEVEQEAGEYLNHQRTQTQQSLRGMRDVLRSLAALDGPKTVILISEGLVLEGLGGEVDEIAAIAADVRATIEIMLLDVPSVDVSQRERPSTPREDRDRQIGGLEMLAGYARGSVHRIVSTADAAFVRIARSMAGHYLIGVEARPADRDGRRHRISVKTTRRGLTVHSRRGFLATMSAAASSPVEAVERALRGPLTINDVPMRLATWTYKEPGSSQVRLLVTAEVERLAGQSLDYTAGLLVIDRDNRAVTTSVERRTLRESGNSPGAAVFSGAVVVAPGSYRLRFAVADSEGRVGSIERRVEAWQMNTDGLTVGDLLIGEVPEAGDAIAPAIEPLVGNGRLVAMMEVYETNLTVDGVTATLDVVTDERSAPLLSVPMQVRAGDAPEVGLLQSVLSTAALPPGSYLARATVRQGAAPRGHITRPFRVGVARAASDGAAAGGTASLLPSEVLQSLLATLPAVDRQALTSGDVLSAVLDATARARPGASAAVAAARKGALGPAAVEALGAGDQVVAAFLRGVDLFSQGQNDRALQQLQIAMQQAPQFAPARLYLGAALAQGERHREAAGLLQSVSADVAGPAPLARMTAVSWLRAGDAAQAIGALESAHAAGDAAVVRTLALAYVAAGRPADALPLLAQHLHATPDDRDGLLMGVYATYAAHAPAPRRDTITEDRARAQAWARAYATRRGEHQGLVEACMKYLLALP